MKFIYQISTERGLIVPSFKHTIQTSLMRDGKYDDQTIHWDLMTCCLNLFRCKEMEENSPDFLFGQASMPIIWPN